jgi:hypothetical protein
MKSIPISPELTAVLEEIHAEITAAQQRMDWSLRAAVAALGLTEQCKGKQVGLENGCLLIPDDDTENVEEVS